MARNETDMTIQVAKEACVLHEKLARMFRELLDEAAPSEMLIGIANAMEHDTGPNAAIESIRKCARSIQKLGD